MTRIPYLRREELGPEGQQLWDAATACWPWRTPCHGATQAVLQG